MQKQQQQPAVSALAAVQPPAAWAHKHSHTQRSDARAAQQASLVSALLPVACSHRLAPPPALPRFLPQVECFQAHADVVCSMAMHPKGECLLTSSVDGTIKVWV